jgi:hypothetical protein
VRLANRDWGSIMRVAVYLAAAGLLLSGCTSLPAIWPGTGATATGKQVPAAGAAETEKAWYARGNCAWEDNAYHYQCDPNANY